MYKLENIKPESIPMIGIALACIFWILACIFWVIDAVIPSFIFGSRSIIIDSLLSLDASELWMRLFIVLLIMTFSFSVMFILKGHYMMKIKLNVYKSEFENIIEQRTNAMYVTNSLLREEIMERRKIEKKLVKLATIDQLTSIPNRRKFDEVLQYELNRDSRYKNELSLVFCDLDYFKRINDRYGHKIGDNVLKSFTRLITKNIRKTDTVARWGGEEFALLLPETDLMTAIDIAEKLRKETEAFIFPEIDSITASFGVAQFVDGDTETSLINRADEALYEAKRNGRNRVQIQRINTIDFIEP